MFSLRQLRFKDEESNLPRCFRRGKQRSGCHDPRAASAPGSANPSLFISFHQNSNSGKAAAQHLVVQYNIFVSHQKILKNASNIKRCTGLTTAH